MARATTKKTKANETVRWLMAKNRKGVRRVEILGWRRLAHLYLAAKPGSDVRRVITNEARRCGYTPTTILALNA